MSGIRRILPAAGMVAFVALAAAGPCGAGTGQTRSTTLPGAARLSLPDAGLGAGSDGGVRATLTWRGTAGDDRWSNGANWDGGAVPGPLDVARFDGRSRDAVLDPGSGGAVAGVVLGETYAGTLRLRRDLTVTGTIVLAGGRLEQGSNRLAAGGIEQMGGTLAGGTAPLWVDGAVRVTGGLLETPRGQMRVRTLEIQAPGVVRVGEDGKLDIAGDGTPLTGNGLLDTTTNRPTSVEYTGQATSDLTAAGPAADFRRLGYERDPKRRLPVSPSWARRAALPRPSGFGSPPDSLPLRSQESYLGSAVIDPAAGFAYFGTGANPGFVVKVRLSDFTRVGALTLWGGEIGLSSAVIDPVAGFAYFGTRNDSQGSVVKIRLSDFTRVGSLQLWPGEFNLGSAVIDTTGGFAYFGTDNWLDRGTVVKVRLSDFTRVGAITLNSGEFGLSCAVIDPASGFAYFGAYYPKVVKIRLSDFTRVGALDLPGVASLGSAVIDPSGGFAYFGTNSNPGVVWQVKLSDLSVAGMLELDPGENWLLSGVIDPAAGFAYFGTYTQPGAVVQVRLSDLTRVGAVSFPSDLSPRSAALDTEAGFAYFGTFTDPGVVVRVDVGDRLNTTTNVTSSVNPSLLGQSVTFTATVSPASGTGTPTGTVQFKADGTNFGPPLALASGSADIALAGLTVGTHVITAFYSGDATYSPSVGTLPGGQVVGPTIATTTGVTSSANPSVLGQSVTFTATVSPAWGSGTPTGTVQLKADGTNIGPAVNLASGSASVSTSSLTEGTHVITAVYSGDSSYGASTGTLADGQVVDPAPTGIRFHTLTPCRLLDTRGATGPLGGPALQPGQDRVFALTGVCGVPAGSKALSLNLTVTGPTGAGYLTLHPGDGLPPLSSTINFRAGQTRANNAVIPLASDGSGSLAILNGSGGTVNVILDVNGYFQ